MMLQQVFDEFILSRKLADLSPKSITNYIEFITPFVAHVSPDKPFKDILQSDINNYISNLLKKPLSKATRATYIRHLKIFLRWSSKHYDASYDYTSIRIPRSPKKEVRLYTPDDIALIFDTIHCDAEWLTVRNQAIIALMYDSGLRLSEVCTLRHKNIMFNTGMMIVQGKGDKERTVPIGKLTTHLIRQYLTLCPYTDEMMLLTRSGKPLTTNAVKLMVHKLAEELPFELSSHKLRHNFATNYCLDQYENRGQIDIYHLMYLMGHEEIDTTRRYLHFAYEVIAGKGAVSHLDKIKGV